MQATDNLKKSRLNQSTDLNLSSVQRPRSASSEGVRDNKSVQLNATSSSPDVRGGTTSTSGSNSGTPRASHGSNSHFFKEISNISVYGRDIDNIPSLEEQSKGPAQLVVRTSEDLAYLINRQKSVDRYFSIPNLIIMPSICRKFLTCLESEKEELSLLSNVQCLKILDDEVESLDIAFVNVKKVVVQASALNVKFEKENKIAEIIVRHKCTEEESALEKCKFSLMIGKIPELKNLAVYSDISIGLYIDASNEKFFANIVTEKKLHMNRNRSDFTSDSQIEFSELTEEVGGEITVTKVKGGRVVTYKSGGKERDSDKDYSVEESSGETTGLRGHAGIIGVEGATKIKESYNQFGGKGITINNDNEVLALGALVEEGSVVLPKLEFINITDQGLLPSIQAICNQYSGTSVQIHVISKSNTNNERFSVSQNWGGGRNSIQIQPTGGGGNSNAPIVIQLPDNGNSLAGNLGILATLKQLAPHMLVVLIFQLVISFAFRTGQN